MISSDRLKAAILAIIRESLPQLPFLGVYEYRVFRANSGTFDGSPVTDAYGLPDVTSVPMRPSITGGTSKMLLGSSVLIGFINGDPGRPYVMGGDPDTPPTEADFTASVKIKADAPQIQLNNGVFGVARLGDAVVAGPFGGTITVASATVKAG